MNLAFAVWGKGWKFSSSKILKYIQNTRKALAVQQWNCPQHAIENVNELRLLGVTINSRCTWTSHIDTITRSASRRLYPLRLLRTMPKSVLLTAYNGLIRSLLEYCAPLFIGLTKKDSKKLRKIQKRFHKLMCGVDCVGDCLQDLDARREVHALRLFHKTLKPTLLLHALSPRLSDTGGVILPFVRTNRCGQSFFHKTGIMFNDTVTR